MVHPYITIQLYQMIFTSVKVAVSQARNEHSLQICSEGPSGHTYAKSVKNIADILFVFTYTVTCSKIYELGSEVTVVCS